MNNKTVIYIVRHGETEWNTKNLIQGHKDSPLTKLGIEQTKQLAKELKRIKFDLIFSSDLLRAEKTAKIIATEHKLTVETTKLLRERNFGKLAGKHRSVLKAFDELFASLNDKEIFKYKSSPDVESDEEITTRLITFLRELALAHPGEKALVVTHGAVMRAFLIRLGELSYKKRMWVKNVAYVKLESDGIDFFVKETKGISVKEAG